MTLRTIVGYLPAEIYQYDRKMKKAISGVDPMKPGDDGVEFHHLNTEGPDREKCAMFHHDVANAFYLDLLDTAHVDNLLALSNICFAPAAVESEPPGTQSEQHLQSRSNAYTGQIIPTQSEQHQSYYTVRAAHEQAE
jgi:hypothetical protein